MSGHATINRLYRLVWSETLGAWVAVAENTRGRGKRSGRRRLLAALFAGVGMSSAHAAGPPAPNQLPTGGQVVAGNVALSQQGSQMTVSQGSQRGVVDWQTFNVGSQARVDFVQPSSSAVTLNRVLDTQASQIYGRISANGQVFLSNPNGVYFSPTASVDVGGLVATTHGIDNAAFMAGSTEFQRNGATGSVVNEGSINAALGGYVALLAPEVRNSGVIVAQAGTVALAGGDAVRLQFGAGQDLVGVLATPSQIATLVENGNAVHAPGGQIILSAQAAKQLQDGVVRNSGTLEATGLASRGGKIVLDASGLVDNGGTLDVSGTRGGTIAVNAGSMLNSGSLHADGSAGTEAAGGSIVTRTGGLVETAAASVTARGGGSIDVDAGSGQLYSSASYDAGATQGGQRGGSVTLSADRVALMGARVDASGAAGGGSIRVGGGFQGKDAGVRNASTTTIGTGVQLKADALGKGDGGQVVVWSDQTTIFAGTVSARAGANGGDGGKLEVSGKQDLHFAGSGDAHAPQGKSGQLLLDPKNIYIDDAVSAQAEYIDPHPTDGGSFGRFILPLTTASGGTTAETGYVAIANPGDDLGASGAGAVYLFRRSDQALISTLYGTHAGDAVGLGQYGYSGLTALTNGNFVVSSPSWNGGRGAVTWGSGTTGWGTAAAAAVSASNSLVGSLATFTNSYGTSVSDNVGAYNQVRTLSNGNYLVVDSGWGNNRGAVAFGNGSTGTSGVIDASNALVGSTAMTQLPNQSITYKNGDQIGSSVTILANDNYVVTASSWNKGVGAVSLGSGTAGLSGVVGSANSLVGDVSRFDASGNGSGTDNVGQYLTSLAGSGFVVYTNRWGGSAGAVTWSDGNSLPTGVVSAANSLVGNAGDYLSSGGITLLPQNNAYVIGSPSWSQGKGAATWVPYATDVKTIGVAGNSVTGSATGDSIGNQAITRLENGDYVLSSPNWNGNRGAATLVDGTTGKTRAGQASTVAASNSVVGTQTGDYVAQKGIVKLNGNGNFLVLSPLWNNGALAKAGAVTWSSGTSPTVGAVSAGNSLVGTYANDRIGEVQFTAYNGSTPYDNQYSSVTALANGNYAVASPMWNGNRGAVTWGNGASGSNGAVDATNSMVGSISGDYVGALSYAGASGSNTWIGLGNGIQPLDNGNFVVTSNYWNNGSAARAGAVTFSNGSGSPTVGVLSSANSLVGSTTDDQVGTNPNGQAFNQLHAGYDSDGNQLYSSNYVIASGRWDNGALSDAGAITWGSGTSGVSGTISAANSIVGLKAHANDRTSITALENGNYVALMPQWDNGGVTDAGAAAFVSGTTGRLSDYAAQGNRNIVGAGNSLVGSTSGDMDQASVTPLYNGSATLPYLYGSNYLVISANWDNGGLADAGAVSWGSGANGVSGAISRTNSIVGEKAGDMLGGYTAANFSSVILLQNGHYVVGSSTRDINGVQNAGAATWVDGSTGRLSDYAAQGNRNIVSAANSLVGSHTDDHVGDGLYAVADYNYSTSSNYFIYSTNWNCQVGALTYVRDTAHPLIGVVGPTNSAVGNPNGNVVGALDGATSPVTVANDTALVTFGGGTGHVFEASQAMPVAGGMAIPGATAFGAAADATQMLTPDHVASVLRTGTGLTLQASNDIYVMKDVDASGGTAGGALTLQAGRSIAIMGSLVTGNRDLNIVANDTLAHGVQDAQRDAGAATISMGADPAGRRGTIDAGSGTVSITLADGAGKTSHDGGSISLNSISGASIHVLNQGNGSGSDADLPDLAGNCCGYAPGYRSAAADIVLNDGAVLRASGGGDAILLATGGKFTNNANLGAGTFQLADAGARWLVYADAPGSAADYGNLDSGNTAVWNTGYTGAPLAQAGNRYVFLYQPTVTVTTQNVTKTYGDDLSTGTTLSDRVLSVSGAQAAVAGAYLGDTLATAISGAATVSSAGAAFDAGVAGGPYAINVDLSTVTGNNGYAVALGNNTASTLTVTPKALTAALSGVTKTYDGTNGASLGAANYVLSGLVGGQSIGVTKASGSYDGANAGAHSVSTTLAAGDFAPANGAVLSNYLLPASASGSASITPKVLGASLVNLAPKTYDGSDAYALGAGNYLLSGFVPGESATVARTNGHYNAPNVIGATSVGVALAGGDFTAASGTSLANYVLPAAASGASSILPKSLSLGLTGALGKTYDGTANATLAANNYLLTGFVGSDAATIGKTGGSYNAAGVAAAHTVSVSLGASDYVAGGATLLSNYSLPASATAPASIAPAVLTVTANDATKVYDGTAWHGGNGVSFTGLVGGDTVASLGGSLAYGGSAQGAVNIGNYSIAPGGYTSSNYTISYVDGILSLNPRVLAIVSGSLVGNLDKVYDGSNLAVLNSSNYLLTGFVNGDGATVTKTGGTYDSRNAGIRTVTVMLGSGDYAATGGTNLANYVLPTSISAGATIVPRSVTLAAPNVSKTYDGGTAYAASATDLAALGAGLVGGDTLSSATLAFADKNAGTGNRVVSASNAIIADGNGGNNYSVSYAASNAGTITPRTLHVSATGINGVYDGTVNAAVTLQDDRIAGDALDVTSAGAQYANANAGNGKAIDVNGIGVSGADAANYVLASTRASATGDVAKASLIVSANNAAKTYDGIAWGGNGVSLSGLVGSDSAASLGGSLNYGSAQGAVNSGSYTIAPGGYSSSNYAISYVNGNLVVTPRALAVAVGNLDKIYDGNSLAALNSGSYQLTGFVSGEGAAMTRTSGSYDGKNAGLHTVTVALNSGDFAAASGTLLSNYILPTSASGSATITPRTLTVGASAVNRNYDGGTAASVTLSDDRIAGDALTIHGADAHFADKNAGSAKLVTVGAISLDGADAGNYSLASTTASTYADIAPARIQVSALPTVASKTYDGTTAATLAGTLQVQPVGSDAVSVGGTPQASFADAAVGTAKPVTVSGYQLTGADAGNYVLQQPAGLVGDIVAAPQPAPEPVTPPVTQPVTLPVTEPVPAPVTQPAPTSAEALVPPPIAVAALALPQQPATAQLHAPAAGLALAAPDVQGAAAVVGLAEAAPIQAAAAPAGNPGIVVSLVRQGSSSQNGLVTVMVPKTIAQSGSGYSFPLPAQVVESAAVSHEQIVATQNDGAPLPGWIVYNADSNSFTVNASPQGGLPLEVKLTVGTQQVVLTITEHND